MILETLKGIFQLNNLLMMNVGLLLGIIIGCLPGLNSVFAITVLLPMTFNMGSTAGVLMLLGAYCGAIYGGSISAILINTPGTAAACATVFDGYTLAQKGRAGDALKIALFGSTLGGIVSALALLFLAPQLAKMITFVASPEYFSLCVFGLFAAIGIAGDNPVKGCISALLGLLISTVGMDPFQGTRRFMFGNMKLLAGLRVAVVLLGAFAMSEVLYKSRQVFEGQYKKQTPLTIKKATIKYKELFVYWKTIIRSCFYGIVIGALPGTGGAISAMISYNSAKRSSKHPEEFGQGCEEGILAPETGNNAVTGATMIPLLTFGIPGDAAVAVLLGALTMQGITPGLQLFTKGNPWVYIIMGGLVLVNLFMFLQGSMLIKLFANVIRVPMILLLPIITILCVLGSFAIANSALDVMIMLAFGFLGFVMKKLEFPIPPMTIALVLGNLMETNLRRSLVISKGSMSIFITRPVSLIILAVSFAMLFYPSIKKAIGKRRLSPDK